MIDEQALEAAAQAAFEHWDDGDGLAFDITWENIPHGSVRECWINSTRAAITAYLAALPSDEAAFWAALDALVHRSEVASIWYPDETSHLRRVAKRQDALDNVVELYRQAKGGA